MRDDVFDADRLMTGIVVTVAVSLALVVVPSGPAMTALVGLAFVCGRLGGRDAGLGSVAAGSFMFGWAITEPHFVWEIDSTHDIVLLIVGFVVATVASEIGTRARSRRLRGSGSSRR